MAQLKQQPRFEEIRALGSEIIATRTDNGRTTDKFRFHDLCWQSQAELKKTIRYEATNMCAAITFRYMNIVDSGK